MGERKHKHTHTQRERERVCGRKIWIESMLEKREEKEIDRKKVSKRNKIEPL